MKKGTRYPDIYLCISENQLIRNLCICKICLFQNPFISEIYSEMGIINLTWLFFRRSFFKKLVVNKFLLYLADDFYGIDEGMAVLKLLAADNKAVQISAGEKAKT